MPSSTFHFLTIYLFESGKRLKNQMLESHYLISSLISNVSSFSLLISCLKDRLQLLFGHHTAPKVAKRNVAF